MPPQWIAILCDFLEVCVVTECSQKMSKMLPASVIPPVRAKTSVLNTSPKRSCSEQYGRLSTKLLSLQGWQRGTVKISRQVAGGFLFVCHFAVKVWKHWFDRNAVFNTYSWITMNISWELPGWDQFKLSWCKGATPALPHAAGQLELQTSCLTRVSDLGISLRLPMLCSFINQQPPFLDAFPIIFLSPCGYTIEWGCCRWLELPHLHWAVLKFYVHQGYLDTTQPGRQGNQCSGIWISLWTRISRLLSCATNFV